MAASHRELHLGLMFWATGTHRAGWRLPESKADAAFDIEFLQQVTQIAERAKFDFVFLGDRLATDPRLQTTNPAQMTRLEPFTAGAALAAATSRIGIVITANPTYYDPYTIARLTASLDHLSEGRASWNIVTGAEPLAALNFSRDEHWETQKRYDWADEFVDVVRGLWDTWEDGAFIRDKTTGCFVDHAKVHTLDHKGQYFSVAGPLNVARPVQGHVVILQAGTSDRASELGAREADVIFSHHSDLAEAKAYYAGIRGRAAKYGRAEGDLSILPAFTPIVAETTEKAVAIYDQLNRLLPFDPEELAGTEIRYGLPKLSRNLGRVSDVIGIDVRGNDSEAIVPADLLDRATAQGRALFAEVKRLTRRDVTGSNRIIFRDLIDHAAGTAVHVVGNPEEVADHIQTWFEARACDGFNVFPAYVPGAVEAFANLVVPVLQARGLFRKDYAGPTFRDHLGLDRPPNSLAAKAADSARRRGAA